MVDLAGMLPMVERVKVAATLPLLQSTVTKMMSLIEDASRFVIEYRTDGGPGGILLTPREGLTDLYYV